MKNTRLIKVLESLSKTEMKNLGGYLKAQLFPTGRNLEPIYTYLKTQHPDFKEDVLTKENIFNKLYPGQSFTSGKSDEILRKLFSELLQQTEDFLMVESLKNNRYEQHILKLEAFAKKDLQTLFDKEFKEAFEYASKNSSSAAELFGRLRKLNSLKVNYYYDRGDQIKTTEMLNAGIEYLLGEFYFASLTNLQFVKANSKSFENPKGLSGKNTSIESVRELLSVFNFDEFAKRSEDVRIKIYYLLYLEVKNEFDKNTVIELRKLLKENHKIFGTHELYDLHVSLAAMCTALLVNSGNDIEYNKLLFEIYKDAFEFGVVANHLTGSLDVIRFRNILNTSLNVGESDWAESFVNEYSDKLPLSYRSNLSNLAKANIEYIRKNTQEALDYTNLIKSSGFIFINDLKFLQMKCYYELDYFDNAEALVNSYRHFVEYSKTLPPGHKSYILAFIRQYHTLMSLKQNYDREKYDSLMMELESNKSSWIFKKLQEILPSR